MRGYIERATGELSQIIDDHNTIHGLPKDHLLNGVPSPNVAQDVTIARTIAHPTESKEIMFVDTDATYNQSLLPDMKIWSDNIFDNDTFLTDQEVLDLGYFADLF